VGCTKTPPPVTEVEGIVLLNDKALPNAHVEFIPDLPNFGAELNSTGATDEKGNFKLTCNWKGQPGAVVATHWVIVADQAVPENLRHQDAETQRKLQQFLSKQVNRPIPEEYASVGKTPIRIEVSADQKTYVIK